MIATYAPLPVADFEPNRHRSRQVSGDLGAAQNACTGRLGSTYFDIGVVSTVGIPFSRNIR